MFKAIVKAFICLLMSMPVIAQTSIYPTNWWVGMKDPSLQLMVHKKDIGTATVKMSPYSGVSLVKTYVPENKNYVFIDLTIAPSAKPGKLNFTIQQGKKTESFSFELRRRDPSNGHARIKGVNSSDLVYLIMPDRFSNGDPSNDVVKSTRENLHDRKNPFARHGGDIKGVENKLDYLKDLGVTSVWLTPVLENDMPLMNEWGNQVAGYHGYWFTDHYNVDPRLGGNAAYKQMIEAAHNKGMKVIQDAVYNHVGSHHWFILDQPMKDWLNNWPAYQGSNHKEEIFYDPYASKLDSAIMVGGWFVPHLPDLNLKNPWLAKFLIQHAIWTTEEFGIDGWRVDTYKYCDEKFMNNINAALEREFPAITIFGEAWCNTPLGSAYFVRNNLDVPFKHNLQGVTDFPIAFGMKDAAMSNSTALYGLLAQDALYKDPLKNCIFLENHDMDRILSVLGDDLNRLKIANGLLMTLRGIPQVYYGTEVLMKNFKRPSDAEVRRDFPGGWTDDAENKFNAAGRTAAENDFFNYFRTIAQFRLRSEALQKGKTLQYQPQENVYVYFRYTGKQRVMCVVNPNDAAKEINLERFGEGLAGKTAGKDIVTGQNISLSGSLSVPGKTFMLIELL
ncbi:MAG TPA: alpha-amylase family glycosyl hydrolase [Chitinophagaceae bacterium]|nr:alpha-amylase family glycosyl hydrolase [Chitinophagaceae bacterium]